MKGTTNFVLAGLLIAVCGVAYWLELRKPEAKREEETKGRLLSLDEKRETETVQIVDKGSKVDVQLKCTENCKVNDPNSRWQITSPIDFKADEGNVGTFLTGVMSANVTEKIPLEGDVEAKLKEFGLDKQKRENQKTVIKFKGDSQPYSFYFGDNAAVGEFMYLLAEGPTFNDSAVRIVPNFIRNSLRRNLSYWRAKRIFDFAASEVTGLVIKNPSGKIELTREGTNWYLPGKQLADNETVDTFVTGLAFMNAQEYVSEDKKKDQAKLRLAPNGHYQVTVKRSGKPDVTMYVSDVLRDKEPKLYATFSDRQYVVEIERNHSEKLSKKADAFRFRNLLGPGETEAAQLIEARLGGEKVVFKQEASGWKVTAGKVEGFDPASVAHALNKISLARITEFLASRKIPAGIPELSYWAFSDKAGRKFREFTIYGDAKKNEYYVKMAGGDTGRLEPGSGAQVPAKTADFQAKPAEEAKK